MYSTPPESDSAIDFVVSWVDGGDPEWVQRRLSHDPRVSATDGQRFRDWDTFRFWFRAVERFCPWVRNVILVTEGHVPEWLDTDAPKLRVVRHDEFMPPEHLPTFNSHAIEANLHRIDGLAERFVYFNDDMFVARPLTPEFFFPGGKPRALAAWTILTRGDEHAHGMLAATAAINRHFTKKSVIRRNPGLWFTPKYGADLLKNVALLPWNRLSATVDVHLAVPLLRSIVSAAADAEPDLISGTSASKFRAVSDLAPITYFSLWHTATGKASAASRSSFGSFVAVTQGSVDEATRALLSGHNAMVCLNDDVVGDPEAVIAPIRAAFARIHPDPSRYEHEAGHTRIA